MARVSKPELQRLIDLQHMLLAFRAIDRQLHIPPGLDTFENDMEHSYSLAMIAWFLAPHFPKLDRNKLVLYALAHDLVEIHAGDVFAYASNEVLAKKREREQAAIQKLRAEWPDFPKLIEAIEAYEQRANEEAIFIYALDKLTPALLDYMNEGRGWHYHNITFADFCAEKHKKMPVSPEVYAYMEKLIAILETKPHLFPASSSKQR